MDFSEILNECLFVIIAPEFLIGLFTGMIVVMSLAMFVSVISHGRFQK